MRASNMRQQRVVPTSRWTVGVGVILAEDDNVHYLKGFLLLVEGWLL